jgi:DNA-binding NtrC family response regulator
MPISQYRLVLVVDDDPAIIEVFHKAFDEQENFVLDVAMTVEDALQKIAVVMYDLMFLDMKIGHSYAGMKVLESLRRQEIKQAAEGIPYLRTTVIIMSGSIPINSISQEAHGLDVFHFIDKPVDMTEDFIRRVVNRFGLPLLPRKIDGRSNP